MSFKEINIKNYDKKPENFSGDAVLLILSEETAKNNKNLPFNDVIKELVSRKDFTGKKGALTRVPCFKNIKNIYLIGLDKQEDVKSDLVRNSLAWALRTIGRQRNNSALVIVDEFLADKSDLFNADILNEAAVLSSYKFDKYKGMDKTLSVDYSDISPKGGDESNANEDDAQDKKFSLSEIFIDKKFVSDADKSSGKKFATAQILTRELANEPGCFINPPVLADIAREQAEKFNLECEVWDEAKLKAENMGALLAVGSGSATPPRLIHLIYKPKNKSSRKKIKKIAFVGKGITFDSGGLDIKPESYMKTMKGDKSGACAVLGILTGAAELGLKDIEVHGFMAAAENMPSGSSYRPDDIITARNGKTIEIDNTDAEGRLVLADALCLASELKPDAIIDLATLTGACMVALGRWRAGLFTRDDKLADEIFSASKRRGEDFWRLPAEDEHIEEELKSPFADMINSGPRYGGATFAAIFLSQFVDKNIPYAHLDIAGVDFMEKEWGVYSKGASGFGVRTCLDYLANL